MENTSVESVINIANLKSNLTEYMLSSKKSQTQIATELGISKSTLSLFLQNKYAGANATIANKIEQYLSIGEIKQTLAKEPNICVSLNNTQEVLDKAKITQASNDILLIYGPAGCGKTTALKYYAQNTSNVVYVEADATISFPRSIMTLILETIGETGNRSTPKMMKFLVTVLKNTNKLIIIDEAQHLTSKSFDTLRTLNDKALVGIVYSGNPSILKQMYGKREEEFDQVYSRIGYKLKLENNYTLEDINNIFSNYDIGQECIQYLHKVSQNKGGLRIMTKQYKLAVNISSCLNEKLSIEHLKEAAKRMGIS